MKDRWASLLICFLLIGLPIGFFEWWISGSLRVGLIFGVAFGVAGSASFFLLAIALKKYRRFGLKSIEGWSTNEVIIRSGDANIIRNGIAEGGILFLTNKRLRFVGHRFGTQIIDSSYAVRHVSAAQPAKTFGIFPSGLKVVLNDGRIINFVVNDRKGWVNELSSAQNSQAPGVRNDA
jgi:hypothetical protein